MHDPLLPEKDHDARWQARHRAILESVSRLLAAEGPSAVTMQRIAEEAGFSVGYLYKHFPGKKELLAEILDRQLGVFFAASSRVTVKTAGSPLKALRERIRIATQHLLTDLELVPLLMTVAESFPERVKRRKDPLHHQEVELFRQAMQAGEIRPDDPAYLAAAYAGMVWGLIHTWNQNKELEKIASLPQLVDRLLLQPLEIHPALPRKEDPGEPKN